MCRERPWKLQAERELQGWGGRGRGEGRLQGVGWGAVSGPRWTDGLCLFGKSGRERAARDAHAGVCTDGGELLGQRPEK